MNVKKIVLLANHNNGFNITNFLLKRKDARIVKIVVYRDAPKRWWKSVLELAKEKNLDCIIFASNSQLLKELKNLDIDLLLSVSWRHKIPANILKLPKMGCVSFHNSLLPMFRGAYANTWPILLGHNKTGVTLHYMSKTFDSGKIIMQKQIPIFPWDTAGSLWQRINAGYLLLFKKAWARVDSWKNLSRPQKGKSSYFSIQDFEANNEIDLNKKVKILDFINFLRAKTFEPFYKNAFFIDKKSGKKIYVSLNLVPEKSS